MMNLDAGVRRFDTVFIITLLALFALTSSVFVLLCAKQYNQTTSQMNNNYESRTLSSYFREKVRQNDENGQITITDFCDSQAISITQEERDLTYITYIYEYEGYLYEAFVKEGTPLSPTLGERILPISNFTMEYKEASQLLFLRYQTQDGSTHETVLRIHSQKGSSLNE